MLEELMLEMGRFEELVLRIMSWDDEEWFRSGDSIFLRVM
jgi:hypothetical protein